MGHTWILFLRKKLFLGFKVFFSSMNGICKTKLLALQAMLCGLVSHQAEVEVVGQDGRPGLWPHRFFNKPTRLIFES